MNDISIQTSLKKAVTYKNYRTVIKNLLSEGKSTGIEQTEDRLTYSLLNDKRMDRLDKTLKISDESQAAINELETTYTFLVIAEGWCGDAAQIVPVLNKLTEATNKIDLKIVFRDENETLINQYLTNGSKSIPKILIMDADQKVINSWGPRPSLATKMVQDYIAKNGSLDAEFKKNLQIWYNKDKGTNTQEDILKLLRVSNNQFN